MKIAVVVCTVNRPAILHTTVQSILQQTHMPTQVIICSPSPEHVLQTTRALAGVEVVQSLPGLTRQRNEAMRHVDSDTDLLAFLDDDIQLSRYYLDEMARLFHAEPRISIASGRLLRDGGRAARIEVDEARSLCDGFDHLYSAGSAMSWNTIDSGYGCNMVLRFGCIGETRFDENLPLYAWLEDRDFSFRLTVGRFPPVEVDTAVAVHLGWRSGRVSGVRLGFSTVVNPLYLKRKANTFSMRHIVVHYWMRCFVGNILGVITRDKEYDRWGLLRGNMMGYWHLVTGKCNPEYILQI